MCVSVVRLLFAIVSSLLFHDVFLGMVFFLVSGAGIRVRVLIAGLVFKILKLCRRAAILLLETLGKV